MSQADIKAALQAAFSQCEAVGVPLGARQQEILLSVVIELMQGKGNLTAQTNDNTLSSTSDNPLDDLTPAQRQALLQFVQEQIAQNRLWKVQLLNDWLDERDSGTVQFIREQYGLQWLQQIRPEHLAKYEEEAFFKLQVGDRIEVSNNLWEWVQDDGPCSREWFPCTVVALTEEVRTESSLDTASNLQGAIQGGSSSINCTVRFENGMEYEIQSIYDWNRYNWRRVKG